MSKKLFRAALVAACVCASAFAAAGQQPARTRRGGLDNLSLPSTSTRVASASTGASAWQTFAPEGAGFSVMLPGMPEEPARGQGQTSAQLRSYRLAAGGLKYEIARTPPLPARVVENPGFAEQFFAGAAEGLTAAIQHENPQIKFRLVSQQTISLDGYEGREFEFAAEGHRAVARVFLIEGSLFAVGVHGAKAEMTPDTVNKFLDSFALVQ